MDIYYKESLDGEWKWGATDWFKNETALRAFCESKDLREGTVKKLYLGDGIDAVAVRFENGDIWESETSDYRRHDDNGLRL